MEQIPRSERDIKTLESQRSDDFPKRDELRKKREDLAWRRWVRNATCSRRVRQGTLARQEGMRMKQAWKRGDYD